MRWTVAATMGIVASQMMLCCCGVPVASRSDDVKTTIHPTAWLAETLAKNDAPPCEPDPALPPVVLVHGIDGSSRDMARLARALRAAGRSVHAVDLEPSDGSARLEDLSAQLADFILAELPGTGRIDLVGYSMGGIVARHYLQERGGHERVRCFVTISSPHHGTLTAWLRRGEGACQMRLGSAFLQQLAAPESAANLPPTISFQTMTDLIIVPFTSSTLAGAENVRLIGWGHFTGILEPHALRRIVAALGKEDVATGHPHQ